MSAVSGQEDVTEGSEQATDSERSLGPSPRFRLDIADEQLWCAAQRIALRPKTFAVLRYLLERPQRLVRKEELLQNIWGDVSVSEGVLKTSLREIRHALGDAARAPRLIETAHRRGYRFIGRVWKHWEFTDSTAPALPRIARPGHEDGPPQADAFVGRQAELDRLIQAWERAQSGERQIVLVTGEAGIGKTSLVQAWLSRWGEQLAVGQGQCIDQYGAGEAYLPILEALRRLSRGPLRRQLARTWTREAPSWVPHLPGLEAELEGARPAAPPLAAPPERMLSEMAEALEAFTREQPLVLWLEDLHWADHSTLACISYLARRTGPARLLLLGTYRPQAIHSGHPLVMVPELLLRARCQEIQLGFLSPPELELYFAQRLGTHGFPPALLRLVYAQTAGNPLFIDRVVESWLKRGVIAQTQGAWQLAISLEEVASNAPDSVAAVIQRELDQLDGFEREVLESAGVAGMEFSTAALAAALGEDLVRVEAVCLRWARRRQFLQAGEQREWPDGTSATRCEFIHALYQQVVAERVGPARRAQLHARIAARKEAAYGPRAPEIAAELAVHFERGQQPARALRYLGAAGEQALRRGACHEAIVHFQHGLKLLERLPPDPQRGPAELELLVALGSALAMTRGHAAAEVERVYARARELCQGQPPTTQLFQALMGIGAFYLMGGEYRTARALGEQVVTLARQHTDPDLALEGTLLSGISRIFLGDQPGAVRDLEYTIAVYHPERHAAYILLFMQDPGVCAHAMITLPLWILGYPERALERAERALQLAVEIAHPTALVLAHLGLAQLTEFRGETTRVREHAEAGLALAIKHGFDLYRETLSLLLGSAQLEQAEPQAGLARMQQSWYGLQCIGTEFCGARWRSLLALALARHGRARDALELLVQGFQRVQTHEDRGWEPELYRALGEVLAQAAAGAELLVALDVTAQLPRTPEACFVRAGELARESQARAFELRAALSLASHARACGDGAAARAQLASAYHGFSEGFGTADLRRARELLTELGC